MTYLMTNYYEPLNKLYCENNLIVNGEDVLLHEHCKYCKYCWDREKSIAKRGGNWNKISFPYIGDNYSGKLMCIGINMNGHGGKNALTASIIGEKGVIYYLKEGKKLMFANKNPKPGEKSYGGTILWHRIAMYSYILLNGQKPKNREELCEIYKQITFVNAIKCSPKDTSIKNDNSYPEQFMYEYCLKNILIKEIEILKPETILILGKKTPDILKKNCKWEKPYYSNNKNIEFYKLLLNNLNINVYKMIHPTAPKGNKEILYDELCLFRNTHH